MNMFFPDTPARRVIRIIRSYGHTVIRSYGLALRHLPRLPGIEASSLPSLSFQFKFPGGGMSDIQRGLGELC